nr:PREDICTED: uncharacterized protein LOC105678151 [Linepithema humile]
MFCNVLHKDYEDLKLVLRGMAYKSVLCSKEREVSEFECPQQLEYPLEAGSAGHRILRELISTVESVGMTAVLQQQCSVKGLGPSIDLNESVEAIIESKHTAYRTKLQFLITENIIERLPLTAFEMDHIRIPSHLRLADNEFHIPARVDALLGASIFWELLCIGQIKLSKGQLILQKRRTHLGWIVAGGISDIKQITLLSCMASDNTLHEQVQRFWNIEEIEQNLLPSKNDEYCEADFVKNCQRDSCGRFTVSLPFKGDPNELGESREHALKRFHKLKKRLESQPDIKELYVRFMQKYLELGHMSQISSIKETASKKYYIPHHAVVTNINNRIKLRVVFNASARTTSGIALNDLLRVGPTIQPTLLATVVRFRQYQFVMTADIVKIADINQPIQEYRLNTVTYGLASAPFLAIQALQQTGQDAQQDHFVASQVICDFYVDNLLTGSDNLSKLQALKQEIIEILRSAGFKLAKWNSNEPSLITQSTDNTAQVLNIGEEKTLGLTWNSATDTFQYRVVARNNEGQITKRTILSIVSQIFDPLGLIGPSTIKAKIMLQQMWQLKLSWDDSLLSDLHTEWTGYVEHLKSINDICIPRITVCHNPARIDLHGFSDASESAYGACVYLHSVDQQGNVTIRLLCAKSRVAPLQTVCVPRLELCGALLLAKLVHQVIGILSLPIHTCYYWCDSTIVLAWIHGEPYLRKAFVANRITEIQQLSAKEAWRHVNSEDNPADVILRGVNPHQLSQLRLW